LLPAKAGFVTFALSGILLELLLTQQRTAVLPTKDLANIRKQVQEKDPKEKGIVTKTKECGVYTSYSIIFQDRPRVIFFGLSR